MHNRQVSLPNTRSIDVDLSSVACIEKVLDKLGINLVIHAAAMTNIEACEKSPLVAHHVNVNLAANVATASKACGASLIHISTDHLFDGSKSLVDEEEPVKPLNVYSRTKADAELIVLKSRPDALVIRTNFYGWGTSYRSSFSDFIITSLKANRSIGLFSDVYFTPIFVDILQDVVLKLWDRKCSGIFNVVSDQRISKFDFGVIVANKFRLNSKLIEPTKFANRSDLVSRPQDLSLSNDKTSLTLDLSLGSPSAHLIQMAGLTKKPQVSIL
jgi:dTDP-4-dehydrorhamnose reductase